MPVQSALKVLIVEPNSKLAMPYRYLSDSCVVSRFSTVELALEALNKINPDLVFLSASFSPVKSVKFLESLKNFCQKNIVPLVIVVDLSCRINFVPGTSWGGKIAILDSFVSKKELFSTLNRVLEN